MKTKITERNGFSLMFFILCAYQFIRIGLINNDGLLRRLSIVSNDVSAYLINRGVEQARTASLLILPKYYLFYFFKSEWWFNGWMFLCILGTVHATGYFISLIISDKGFSFFYMIITMLFMSITFEHTLPQSYAGFGFTYILFMIGVFGYRIYLQTNQKKYLLLTALGILNALFEYEMFFAFMPMYVLVAYKEKNHVSLREVIKCIIFPVVMGIAGLAVKCADVLGNAGNKGAGYEGNTLMLDSISKIFGTMKQLLLSSMPGYYLFNKKYRYLMNIYKDKMNWGMVIALCAAAMAWLVLDNCWKRKDDNEKNVIVFRIKHLLWLLGIGGMFMVLPVFPYCVSKRYQSDVSADNMIAVPGSFFSYLAVMAVVTYLLYVCIMNANRKYKAAICIAVIICAIPIQMMNSVFVEEHAENWDRYIAVESMLQTDLMAGKKGEIIAQDLYQTYDALAVRNNLVDIDYWTAYMKSIGNEVQLTDCEYDESKACLYRPDKNTFIIYDRDEVDYISKEYVSGMQRIKKPDGSIGFVYIDEPQKDGKWYVSRAKIQ